MVSEIVSVFYKNKIELDINTNSLIISDIIKQELENIENLPVWKLYKEKLDKYITISTYEYYDYKNNLNKKVCDISSILYYREYAYIENYDSKKINEKFPKELLEYVISVDEIF